jgi:hypothetical protein
MNAAIYYTLAPHKKNHLPAFSKTDQLRLNMLLEQLQADGHTLCGIYITDYSAYAACARHRLLACDARRHRFDLLYLYLYGAPMSVTAKELLDILNLPVDGGTSMHGQKLVRLAEVLASEKAPVR